VMHRSVQCDRVDVGFQHERDIVVHRNPGRDPRDKKMRSFCVRGTGAEAR
jgi:hypothetical protein